MAKITCLITSQPAEGESVEVEFICDEYWQEQLATLLEILDTRLHSVNSLIIEDMACKESMNDEVYAKLIDTVNIQFPSFDEKDIRFNDARILVRKMTNNREQIALRFDCSTLDNVSNILEKAFNLLDRRMIQTNQRDLEAYSLFNSYTPEEKIPIQMVLDCLYGRADKDQIAVRLSSHALIEAKEAYEKLTQQFEKQGEQNDNEI